MGIGKVDDRQLFQFGVGVDAIAVQAEVLGAGGFAGHDDGQHGFGGVGIGRTLVRIGADAGNLDVG